MYSPTTALCRYITYVPTSWGMLSMAKTVQSAGNYVGKQ